VKAWLIRRGSEFENNEYYYETIDFNAILRTDAYNLTQNAKICFVCDGSGKRDQIFIDEVKFEGYGPPPCEVVLLTEQGTTA